MKTKKRREAFSIDKPKNEFITDAIRDKAQLCLYILLTFVLCIHAGKYPAALVLLPALLLYEISVPALWWCSKKRGAENTIPTAPFHCTLLLTAADLYGLIGGDNAYFLFTLLCSCVGIALFIDLVTRLGATLKSAGKIAGHKIPRIFRHPVILLILYLVIGALLPFLYQPAISNETAEAFDFSAFYSSEASGERAKIISQNAEALEDRIRMISQATERIILSTFEIDADNSGKMVLAALMEAAGRGVQVSLLADGLPFLTSMWGNPYFLALAQTENVEIRICNPPSLLKPWTFMGRLHDKYLIVDDLGYILGGRNTYDYFLGDQEGNKNYDWDVLMYSKEAAEDNSLTQVLEYFQTVWGSSVCRPLGSSRLWANTSSVTDAKEALRNVYQTMAAEHQDWLESPDYEEETVSVNHIELVSNPTHIFSKEPIVYYTITELMKAAQESVTFHTPYIICNQWMLERLETICDAVPDVTMMTNSVANNGNPFGASDYSLNKGEILETGVRILEYDSGISYHGKCFVIDGRLSGIGSFNWDMRSAYQDTELMLVIDSEEVNQLLREEMQRYEDDALAVIDEKTSVPPDGEEVQTISFLKKAVLLIMRLFYWARFVM